MARKIQKQKKSITRIPKATAQPFFVSKKANDSCDPASGYSDRNCSAYWKNSWWLPFAYANNATCACQTTGNSPTAKCVRKSLQDKLSATPTKLKFTAAAMKRTAEPTYSLFVQSVLTPRIYKDHVDAYNECCCPSGPAPYWTWVGVTTVPIQPCSLVGTAIRQYGSCHGTPGRW